MFLLARSYVDNLALRFVSTQRLFAGMLQFFVLVLKGQHAVGARRQLRRLKGPILVGPCFPELPATLGGWYEIHGFPPAHSSGCSCTARRGACPLHAPRHFRTVVPQRDFNRRTGPALPNHQLLP